MNIMTLGLYIEAESLTVMVTWWITQLT